MGMFWTPGFWIHFCSHPRGIAEQEVFSFLPGEQHIPLRALLSVSLESFVTETLTLHIFFFFFFSTPGNASKCYEDLSYRNQLIDLHCKSMGCFLYEGAQSIFWGIVYRMKKNGPRIFSCINQLLTNVPILYLLFSGNIKWNHWWDIG